jgi:hypothetical protein
MQATGGLKPVWVQRPQIILSRNKALEFMGIYKLVSWLSVTPMISEISEIYIKEKSPKYYMSTSLTFTTTPLLGNRFPAD